jgi:prepilin-type N-terminal cleavage/methylation domain-containing protein
MRFSRFSKSNRGFTIIEIVTAIAILVLIASVVIFNLQAPKEKARDAQRISDLQQIQLALRLHKEVDPTNSYPAGNLDEAGINATLASHLSGTIRDPLSGTPGFGYGYENDDFRCPGKIIIYAQSTETGNGNWGDVCDPPDFPPGTDTYVIEL